MEKSKLLDRLSADGEERLMLARVLDKLEQAEQRSVPACTDFLSPREQALAQEALRMAGTDRYCLSGGYEGAERQMLMLLPDWMPPENAEFPLCCLRASFRPEYRLTHRDILGSLMGQGIVREKVGDLLVCEESCDLVTAASVAEFLLRDWVSAGRAALRVVRVEPENLHIPKAKSELLKDTVSALRLDAVAASGFRMSRGRAAELVQTGRVQVNWKDCGKPDRLLAQGDTVTARGLGKFVLREVGGLTKKGRTGIVIERFM